MEEKTTQVDEQLKVLNEDMLLTNDNWDTAKLVYGGISKEIEISHRKVIF